jgi:catechol 2,3-dioxygenase-like lactoylglutathione lyase family enzyme/GNAT superfamily N-acetyltransferase
MQTSRAAPLIGALNHVAIVTRDLDRFMDFYCRVLGLEVVFFEDTPALRHAILRSGPLSWLHPVEAPDRAHATAKGDMLERGHLDHISLAAASPAAFDELRRRLVACGASDGGVDDLGAFRALWFCDPDGMRVELALIVDPALRAFHAPTPLPSAGVPAVSIQRLADAAHWPDVDRLLREYVPWIGEQLADRHDMHLDDEQIEMHHAAFARETGPMLAGPGRLLLARLHGEPAGVVALKAVDREVAEIKRLYVRPSARGHGIGRMLLQSLLSHACEQGFRTIRLETMGFMAEARVLYEALGFVKVMPFEGSQAAMSGLLGIAEFMTLALRPAERGV